VRKAFTLIELLVVIAIIAILALIAIPNFLEAQTRSKVAKVMSDHRAMATAIEAYYVDNNAYPMYPSRIPIIDTQGFAFMSNNLYVLNEPVNYIDVRSSVTRDPFSAAADPNAATYQYMNVPGAYGWARANPTWSGCAIPPLSLIAPLKFSGPESRIYLCYWALTSPGPDRQDDDPLLSNPSSSMGPRRLIAATNGWNQHCAGNLYFYDPSNGTVSRGNIWRIAPGAAN